LPSAALFCKIGILPLPLGRPSWKGGFGNELSCDAASAPPFRRVDNAVHR
jgi:hypothetical protein